MNDYDSDDDEYSMKPMFRYEGRFYKEDLTYMNGLDMERMFFYSYTIKLPGKDIDIAQIGYDIFEDDCDPDGCPNYADDKDIWNRHLFHDELIQAAAHPKRVAYALSKCEDPEEYFNNI